MTMRNAEAASLARKSAKRLTPFLLPSENRSPVREESSPPDSLSEPAGRVESSVPVHRTWGVSSVVAKTEVNCIFESVPQTQSLYCLLLRGGGDLGVRSSISVKKGEKATP